MLTCAKVKSPLYGCILLVSGYFGSRFLCVMCCGLLLVIPSPLHMQVAPVPVNVNPLKTAADRGVSSGNTIF